MLTFLKGKRLARKLRLYACACCRRVWRLLGDERSRGAIEVSERFADRSASARELRDAWNSARAVDYAVGAGGEGAAVWAVRYYVTKTNAWQIALFTGADSRRAAISSVAGEPNAEEAAQAGLLRDIIGSLFFAPVAPDATWLTPTVTRLARAAYEERRLPEGTLDLARLAVLADALEDAGCADPDLLAHLRGPGPHVRGCWAVDLLLGKS
jgi:hypothetical protein